STKSGTASTRSANGNTGATGVSPAYRAMPIPMSARSISEAAVHANRWPAAEALGRLRSLWPPGMLAPGQPRSRDDMQQNVFYTVLGLTVLLALIVSGIAPYDHATWLLEVRSEERRVGKECRSRS